MTTYSIGTLGLLGYNNAYAWQPSRITWGKYWVASVMEFSGGFAQDGEAVIDNFGNLVRVA